MLLHCIYYFLGGSSSILIAPLHNNTFKHFPFLLLKQLLFLKFHSLDRSPSQVLKKKSILTTCIYPIQSFVDTNRNCKNLNRSYCNCRFALPVFWMSVHSVASVAQNEWPKVCIRWKCWHAAFGSIVPLGRVAGVSVEMLTLDTWANIGTVLLWTASFNLGDFGIRWDRGKDYPCKNNKKTG